jgi:Fe-Mn family superoxide dismutase
LPGGRAAPISRTDGSRQHAANGARIMALELPALPYDYDSLAPFMSRETLEFHHDKHHMAYVTNGNNLLKDSPHAGKSIEEICVAAFNEKHAGLINNVGQHYNHIHFWHWMKKGGGGTKLPGAIAKAIDADLGGYDKFKADFIAAGTTQFGSGWAWLAVKDGKLAIMKTPNGENPLMHGAQPILGCDVWEHSYYIDYRNLRPKYLEAFVDSLVNWDYVEQMLAQAK